MFKGLSPRFRSIALGDHLLSGQPQPGVTLTKLFLLTIGQKQARLSKAKPGWVSPLQPVST